MLLILAGDSITDSGRREPGRAPLGDGYASIVAATLKPLGWAASNVGVAGDRLRDLRGRWDVDGASKPDAVSILIGINDVWRRFSDGDPTSTEDFECDYRAVLETLDSRTVVILCEPFLLPLRDGQSEWRSDLDAKRDVVARLAAERATVHVPLHERLSEDVDRYGLESLTTDGVHLTPLGHERLAHHWLSATLPVLATAAEV